MHAEPTTYGAKFALFALQVQRDVERAMAQRAHAIAVGKLSGAVGTFSNIDPPSRRTSARASASWACPRPR
jgi:adenylosuccinate lyase